MNKVLVLYSSMIPNNNSYSYELGKRFIKYYKEKNPNDEIKEIDLNNEKIFKEGINSDNIKNYFKESDKYISWLKNNDKLIFITPMNNFNISSVAKNFLDRVLVANKTFSYKYSKKGDAIGLVTNLKVQILTTQGAPLGWYQWGNLGKYLEGTFKFMGCKVLKPLTVSGTKLEQNTKLGPKKFIETFNEEIKKRSFEF